MIGERIREVRESRGVSLSQLARDLETSNSRVRSWENGDTPCTGEHLERIARALGCRALDLLPSASGEPGFILNEHERALVNAVRRRNPHDVLALIASILSSWTDRSS